jgi:collagenase-like PrtC family protease
LLLNATCDSIHIADEEHMKDVVKYVYNLYQKGLKAVSVANALYLPLLKDMCPNLEIISSINCYVKTVEHAIHLKNAGFDIITIDRDINYDLEIIKNIKGATGLKIQILLNEGCLDNCPYRQLHFNLNSHQVPVKDAQFFIQNACLPVFDKHPEKVLSSPVIRPEDVYNYYDLVDYFKISSRNYTIDDIDIVLQGYINEEYKGNFLDLISSRNLKNRMHIDNTKLKGLFEKKIQCLNKKKIYGCLDCSTCQNFFNDAVIEFNRGYTNSTMERLLQVSDISKAAGEKND